MLSWFNQVQKLKMEYFAPSRHKSGLIELSVSKKFKRAIKGTVSKDF